MQGDNVESISSRESYTCQVCQKSFQKYASLAQHIRHSVVCNHQPQENNEDSNKSSSITSVSSSNRSSDNVGGSNYHHDFDNLSDMEPNSPAAGGLVCQSSNNNWPSNHNDYNKYADGHENDDDLDIDSDPYHNEYNDFLLSKNDFLSSDEEDPNAREKRQKTDVTDATNKEEQESSELLGLLAVINTNTHKSAPIPIDTFVSVQLLELLKKARAPLYLFGEIRQLFHDTSLRHPELLLQQPIPRDTVIQSLYERYALSGLRPTTTAVKLPSGSHANIVRHDFSLSLFSLLTDPRLMQPSHLLIDSNNPTVNRKPPPGEVGDLDTGELYKMGWDKYCTEPNKDVLCALIFFIDKTHTDVQGKLPVEPVTFTLSIFRRHIRNLNCAWRTLGYIPNQDLLGKSSSPQCKVQDYHAMLEHIFEQIYEVQESGGIQWQFDIDGIKSDVVLKLPVMLFLGDTEGQDKLVGRYSNRSARIARLCRYCTCPTDKTDDPYFKFKYVKQATVENFVKKNQVDSLRGMSHYLCRNAVHRLQFCDQVRGIHGATPFEIVHTIQLGWHVYALLALYKQKKYRKEEHKKGRKSKKRLKYHDDDDLCSASVYRADDSNQTELNVFSPTFSKIFDKRAKEYGQLLQDQSDRDLPRTYFAQGIIPSDGKLKKNKKKFAAHEQQGCILVILVILHSEQCQYFVKHMGDEKLAAFISVFEKCILLENLLQAESLLADDVEVIGQYIPLLMDLYKRSINRKEGMGNKFVKFHLLTHFYDDLKRNGVCQNTTSGPGESRHKIACKQPARNTQRIADLFEGQLGTQYADNVVIDRTFAEISAQKNDTTPPSKNSTGLIAQPIFQSKRFFYQSGKIRDFQQKIGVNRYARSREWYTPKLRDNVEDYLESEVAPFVEQGSIVLFTMCKHNGIIYRASPLYKNKRAWNDWAYINVHNRGIYAAQFILYVDIHGLKQAIGDEDFLPVKKDGVYAIAHMLPVPLYHKPIHSHYGDNHKAHQGSLLFEYSQKKLRSRQRGASPSLFLVDPSSIVSPCVAVPDLDATKDLHSFIFLKSRCKWQKIFLDHMRKELLELSSDDDAVEDQADNGVDDEDDDEDNDQEDADNQDDSNDDDEDNSGGS